MLDCCAVSDALDRLSLAGAVTCLRRQSGKGRIAGRVITVKLGTGDPLPGPPKHLAATAIECGGPDDIIVIEQRTGIEAACWGGLLTLGAIRRGVAGVIADGPVRDIDEARSYEFPIFARSATSLTARGRIVELGTNIPVTIGAVRVNPGDYVVADGSAVVFVPVGHLQPVLETAEMILAREAEMAKRIAAGVPIGEVLGGSYESLLKK